MTDIAKIIEKEHEINALLEKNQLFGEVYSDSNLPIIYIKIDGDWKHDHLFLASLIKENGYSYIGNHITSSDSSDSYEAVHSVIV